MTPDAVAPQDPAVPPGLTVYAVGDVHGRRDLLDRLMDGVARDFKRLSTKAASPFSKAHLIFLGDYVDRGPASAQVLDRLSGPPPEGTECRFLKGNHDAMMLDALSSRADADIWFANGGGTTLESYGLVPEAYPTPGAAVEALDRHLPDRHRSFLKGLSESVTIGDYFFVHAGVRPGVPLDQQSSGDLMWIRHEFLQSDADFGKTVVHGHTISPAPVTRSNRIGIDTGACRTGCLTCLVLTGKERRFLSTR